MLLKNRLSLKPGALWVLLVACSISSPAIGQEDTAKVVANLLAERCADCHTPDSDEKKARRKWDGAKDIWATVQDPELIIPGNTDDSELLQQILFDEMPPEDSDVSPLSEVEKALLSAWVHAGSPTPSRSEEEVAAAANPRKEARGGWMSHPLMRWKSHFHPVIVHFPIALITMAFVAELLARFRRKTAYGFAADFCLIVGALSSIPAAALGWALAENSNQSGSELDLHRWLGVASMALSLAAIFAVRKKPNLRLPIFIVLAVLVGVTGHFGGVLTYGADWLDWPSK